MKRTFLGLLWIAALPLLAEKAQDLTRPAKGETARVIVQYREDPAQTPEEAASRRKRVHQQIERKGAKLRAQFENVNASVYEASAEALDALENDPNVLYVSPDREVGATIDPNAQCSARFWPVIEYFNNNSTIRKGSGLSVAVIDSGLASHPNFGDWTGKSRIVYSQSWVGTGTGDEYGHGTHVAGIIASNDRLAGNYTELWSFWGPAVEANLVNLKVLDAEGKGLDSSVISAIDRAISLRTTYNIRVINLSLGRPIFESYTRDPLAQAVERAWRAGITVVVAAGNHGRQNVNGSQGYGTITSPGNHPMVITVGAVNNKADCNVANDYVASYSSKGPTFIDRIVKPDIVVPGSQINSLQATGSRLVTLFPGNRMTNSQVFQGGDSTPSPYFIRLNGTSMAAPLVSSAALLMLSKESTLTPDQIKYRMMRTAQRPFARTDRVYDAGTNQWFTVNHDIFTMGTGMLNLEAAFWNTERPTAPAHSPRAVYDAATKSVKLQFNSMGTNVLWGDNTSIPSNVLWGDNVRGSNVLWGDNVVWGSSTMAGFNVVWGSGSTWLPGTSGMTANTTLARGE